MDKNKILEWIKDNGNIIKVHAQNTSVFNLAISLGEIGITDKDIRAKGLRRVKRDMIFDHVCCHYLFQDNGDFMLGYDSPATALYFNKPIEKILFMPDGVQEATGKANEKWFLLDAPDWPKSDFRGQSAHWLKLTPMGQASQDDLKCNPIKSLASLETSMRTLTKSYGQELESMGLENWSWIGHKAWEDFLYQWGFYQGQLEAVKAYLKWRYSEFEAKLAGDFEEIAIEAWDVMRENHRLKLEASYKAMNIPDYREKAREAAGEFVYVYKPKYGSKSIDIPGLDNFIEFVCSKARKKFPTVEQIDEISIDYRPLPLILHQDIARDRLTAAEMEQQAQEALAKATEAENQAAIAEAEKQLEMARIEAKKEAMKLAAIEKAREQIATMANPLDEMMSRVRAEIFEAVARLKIAFQEKGNLSSPQIKQARELIDRFRLLNTHDDNELESQLEQLSNQLPKGKKVDYEVLNQNLTDIVNLTREAAEKVLKSDVAEDYGIDNLRL